MVKLGSGVGLLTALKRLSAILEWHLYESQVDIGSV